jgi:hypothetical protein
MRIMVVNRPGKGHNAAGRLRLEHRYALTVEIGKPAPGFTGRRARDWDTPRRRGLTTDRTTSTHRDGGSAQCRPFLLGGINHAGRTWRGEPKRSSLSPR